MKRVKRDTFRTEVDLCRAFLAEVPSTWTPFNETAGWDILLVRKADGFQIGVQAKLRLNAHVIAQAVEDYGHITADRAGPDCRAVLVPRDAGAGGFHSICQYIGLTVISVTLPRHPDDVKHPSSPPLRYSPPLPGEARSDGSSTVVWHEWAPVKRHALPDYVPDVVAGSPSPLLLSQWKIKAIKVSVCIDRRGFVTRADFKHIQFDHRRLLTSGMGWLIADKDTGGYVRSNLFPDLRKMHPGAYPKIAADWEKWSLPKLELQLATSRIRARGEQKALL